MKSKAVVAVLFLACVYSSITAESVQNYTAGHYQFSYPENYTGIEDIADIFNRAWNTFNEFFRFDSVPSQHVCKVVILADKTEFNSYLIERIGKTRDQYVFLKYSRPELSELVLYVGDTDFGYNAFAGPVLNRQLFLQYLYGFVAEPPIWLRDGFQAYFEQMQYDEKTDNFLTGGYSPWLETVKKLHIDPEKNISAEGILSALTGTYEAALFYPQAWAFVSFLLNTEKSDYQRFLYETCILLEDTDRFNDKSQQENTDLIKNRFLKFHTVQQTDADFSLWLSSQHTFSELLQAGVSAYNQEDYKKAETELNTALSIRNDDPILVYYLGLVSYAEKRYPDAEGWYKKALGFGADVSTVNWALGLNAFADKRYDDARKFLETAISLNPDRYTGKAEELLNSMPK